ncbi:MAG TPA: CBASS cGAMP synthase [Burkholderiales bacterium]|nr:CBASS cGAMP synthase [Burkholderiales bacterium]
MLNLHRLFYHHIASNCYLAQLTLPQAKLDMLRAARLKIRNALREGISKATRELGEDQTVTPRFFTQGSYAYGTLNRPTHVPPQQADMDDGCYLPMSFVKGAKPKRSAQIFFQATDTILKELVKKEGWQGYSTERGCCGRVIVDNEHHIDVPLYAIRDEAFKVLMKAADARGYVNLAEAFAQDDSVDVNWTILEHEDVLLANRDGSWTASDPREVKEWANAAFSGQGGDQLRRISRYLKGWRDQNYKSGGPSSISLMVIAEAHFSASPGRDDLALAEVVEHLADALLGDVIAPWDRDGEEQINRLNSQERQHAASLAKRLLMELRQAINGAFQQAAVYVAKLGIQFGHHFPTDSDLVTETTPAETVAAFPAIITSSNSFPKSSKAG